MWQDTEYKTEDGFVTNFLPGSLWAKLGALRAASADGYLQHVMTNPTHFSREKYIERVEGWSSTAALLIVQWVKRSAAYSSLSQENARLALGIGSSEMQYALAMLRLGSVILPNDIRCSWLTDKEFAQRLALAKDVSYLAPAVLYSYMRPQAVGLAITPPAGTWGTVSQWAQVRDREEAVAEPEAETGD